MLGKKYAVTFFLLTSSMFCLGNERCKKKETLQGRQVFSQIQGENASNKPYERKVSSAPLPNRTRL